MATSVSGTSTSRIVDASSVSWDDWVAALDRQAAREKPHAEIARLTEQLILGQVFQDRLQIPDDAKIRSSPGWWAQGITVAYEQHIGRRVPGQRADGTFEATISKTVPRERAAVMARLFDALTAQAAQGFAGVTSSDIPRISSTEKRDNWRVKLDDGSALQVSTEPRRAASGQEKTAVVVTCSKLASPEAVGSWKTYWKDLLDNSGILAGEAPGR
ncbi:MAG: hypothetical protein ACTHZ5_07465 [Micrococcaceae bacterium]